MRRYVFYMIAAALAIIVNLSTQAFFEWLLKTFLPSVSVMIFVTFMFWFIVALGMGTLIGFVFKFLIDKLLIFKYKTKMAETKQ